MEFRCRPYNPILFFCVLGVFIFCTHSASAQCQGNFSYQSASAERDSHTGKIEVVLQNPDPGTYTFKVYEMNGTVILVQTRQASSPDRITFENLKPATYFVKIEWGESCFKTLGGLEGIIVTEKDQER